VGQGVEVGLAVGVAVFVGVAVGKGVGVEVWVGVAVGKGVWVRVGGETGVTVCPGVESIVDWGRLAFGSAWVSVPVGSGAGGI